jgi:hypothetical protein
VRDSAKEKPTYILMPKREEHTQREKVNAGTSGGTLVPNQEIVNHCTFLSRLFLSAVFMLLNITKSDFSCTAYSGLFVLTYCVD